MTSAAIGALGAIFFLALLWFFINIIYPIAALGIKKRSHAFGLAALTFVGIVVLAYVRGGETPAPTAFQAAPSTAPVASTSAATTVATAADQHDLEAGWIAKGQEAIAGKLKDPSSAQFRKLLFHQSSDGIPVACGEVNSKNSLGGYTGYQKFIAAGASSDMAFLEEEVSDFDKLWRKLCL